MANSKFSRLPAPHDGARVFVEFFSNCKILVNYIGTPEALFAAGAIEAEMMVAGRRGGQGRTDVCGNYICRVKRPKGEIHVSRHFENAADAARLPGVDAAACVNFEINKRIEPLRAAIEAPFNTPAVMQATRKARIDARRSMIRLVVNNDLLA